MLSNIEDKIENPTAHFEHPIDVVHDPDLSHQQKAAILDRLELDAKLMGRADDENMGGGEPDRLIEVMDAKKHLEIDVLPKSHVV